MNKILKTFALAAVVAAAIFAGTYTPKATKADGGPILVCPPGKTHDACTKNNPLPPA